MSTSKKEINVDPLPKPDHEEFAQEIAAAINAENSKRYRQLMDSPDNPLHRPDITRGEIQAIHQRVHWLAENHD